MAGTHPIYSFEYDIEINNIKNGLEHFIDKINEKNELYRTQIRKGFSYDIIHYDIKKDPSDNLFIITVKLFYSYAEINESLLFELFQDNEIEYLNRRIF